MVWDLFPDQARLGGAPANVCYHAAILGGRAVLASRVGNDHRGDEALALLDSLGVDTSAAQRDRDRPTGTVQVSFLSGDPSYEITPEAAWTQVEWTPAWARLMDQADVLCFGSLLQSTEAGRTVLDRAVQAMRPGTLRLCDVNLRPSFDGAEAVEAALAAANMVKLSREEVQELGRRYGQADPLSWLLEERGMEAVAMTRGSGGSVLRTRDGTWEHPGVATNTSAGDPVGAGDSFTAALAHHLCRGHDPVRSLEAANNYAAYVASQQGAMPKIPAEIKKRAM